VEVITAGIFKAYDIRGVVKTALTPEAVRQIGTALGSEAVEGRIAAICVGRDGRLSGPLLRDALVAGIVSTGTDVIDVGMVPTPVLYFSTVHLDTGSGVEITGSHNPPEYNGLKMMMAGVTLHGEAIQSLRRRIESGNIVIGAEPGVERMADVLPAYLDRIRTTVKLARPMKIAIDCGNGVVGPTARSPTTIRIPRIRKISRT
jgi:phosphomannomutase / phosphoglucomutase